MRGRWLWVVGVVAVGLAWGVARIPADVVTPEDRALSREALRVRHVDPPARAVQPDPDDIDAFVKSGEPTADWPDSALRELHRELDERGEFGTTVAGYFPYYRCQMRCTSTDDVPALWEGPLNECIQSCGLDRYHDEPTVENAFNVMMFAGRNENAALFEQVVRAHPEVWQWRRDNVASMGARGVFALWWGDTMRARAPTLQKRIFAAGHEQGGVAGVLSIIAAGHTACAYVGDEAVCP